MQFFEGKYDSAADIKMYAELENAVRYIVNPAHFIFENEADKVFYSIAEKSSKSGYRTINTKDFISILLMNYQQVYNKYKEQFQDDKFVMSEEVFNDIAETLFKELKWEFVSGNKSKFTIKDTYPTLKNVKDYTYPTISKIVHYRYTYKGFHVYQDENQYFYTDQRGVTPNTMVKRFFNSEQDVNEQIDHDSLAQTFKKNWRMEFRNNDDSYLTDRWETRDTIYPGSIIRILNVKNIPTNVAPQYAEVINSNMTLADFKAQYQGELTNEQLEILDSIEAAGIFMHLVSNMSEQEAINIISEAKVNNDYVNYYVTDFKKGDDTNTIYAIESKDVVEQNEQFDKPQPIIDLLYRIASNFEKNFGVKTEVVTEAEFKELFSTKDQDEKIGTKDGVVYVNGFVDSRAQIYEYAQWFMSIIRNTNSDLYQAIADKVMKEKFGQNEYNRIKTRNPEMGNDSLIFETVSSIYGYYLKGEPIADILEKTLDKPTQQLFDTLLSGEKIDLNRVTKGKIYDVFSKVSKYMIKRSGITTKTDLKITDVGEQKIEDGLKNKEINEQCQ